MKTWTKWLPALLLAPVLSASAADLNLVKEVTGPGFERMTFGNAPAHKEFSFTDGKAWLDSEGNYHAQILVGHDRLSCLEYTTTIQFGNGNRCNNVEWLGEPIELNTRRHCNKSDQVHDAGFYSVEAQNDFKAITCARVQVLCHGRNCLK